MHSVVARWLSPVTLDWEVLATGLRCCDVVPCPWARHFTYICTLSPQEWMGTWLDSDCLCVWIVISAVMAAGLYAAQGVDLVLELTHAVTREATVTATILQPLAASCLKLPLQYNTSVSPTWIMPLCFDICNYSNRLSSHIGLSLTGVCHNDGLWHLLHYGNLIFTCRHLHHILLPMCKGDSHSSAVVSAGEQLTDTGQTCTQNMPFDTKEGKAASSPPTFAISPLYHCDHWIQQSPLVSCQTVQKMTLFALDWSNLLLSCK